MQECVINNKTHYKNKIRIFQKPKHSLLCSGQPDSASQSIYVHTPVLFCVTNLSHVKTFPVLATWLGLRFGHWRWSLHFMLMSLALIFHLDSPRSSKVWNSSPARTDDFHTSLDVTRIQQEGNIAPASYLFNISLCCSLTPCSRELFTTLMLLMIKYSDMLMPLLRQVSLLTAMTGLS